MNKRELLNLKKKYLELSKDEDKARRIHLREISNGTKFGPMVGYPEIDMPWLKYYEDKHINADIPQVIPYDYILNINRDNLDVVAINFMGKRITYGEMFNNINKCVRALTAQGIKEGDIVTFCTPTTPETIYMFYALNYLGAIANFVDLRTNKERIAQYINDADSKLIISNDNVLKKVNGLISDTCADKIINVSTALSLPNKTKALYMLKTFNKNNVSSKQIMQYNDFIEQGKNVDVINKVQYDGNRTAAIVYTGGTTGVPKGAEITNRGLNSAVTSYRNSAFKREIGDKFVNIMPPFIAYGLVAGIHLPLSCGFEDIVLPSFNPKTIGKLILDNKPAHFIGVPTHFEYMMNDPKLKNADLSFIKNYGLGGDSLNPTKEEEINKFMASHNSNTMLRIGYGMTENSAPTVTNVSNECTKIGSVGVPLINNDIRIVNPSSGMDQTYGNPGEIYISGNQIMSGYFNNDNESKKVLINDENNRLWVKSGDYGYMDSDGNLFIKGRLKNIIVRPDGHNVYPNTVASVLSNNHYISDVCVVGIKSKYGYEGVIPTAYVILKDGVEPSEQIKQEILEFQSHHLPERDGVVDIRFINEFPLTPVGKVDIKRITEDAELSDVDFDKLLKNSTTKKKR